METKEMIDLNIIHILEAMLKYNKCKRMNNYTFCANDTDTFD